VSSQTPASTPTPTRPKDFDFRGAVLGELLFANPLKPASVYVFGILSILLLAAVVYREVSLVETVSRVDGSVLGYHDASPKGKATGIALIAWSVFVPYCLWWGWKIASTLREVTRGVQWLAIADPQEIKRRYEKQRNSLRGIEHQFATVAYQNRIERFDIDNGRLRTQGKVEIEVDWCASDTRDATLYLYSDTGDMQDDVRTLQTRPTARRLEVKRGSRPIRYIQTNVTIDDNYNYYAWIEVDFYGRLILSVENSGHWTRRVETPTEYADRTQDWETARRRVKAFREPPPAPAPKPTDHDLIRSNIKARVGKIQTQKERVRLIQELLDKEDLDVYQKEQLEHEIERELPPV
jgi:hypothetical protein